MSSQRPLYGQDFHAWTLETAEQLRKQAWDQVEWEAVGLRNPAVARPAGAGAPVSATSAAASKSVAAPPTPVSLDRGAGSG
jgi:hypothetical protein